MTYHLAADLGGTKTLLQLFSVENQHISTIKQKRYISANFGSFDEMLTDFIDFDHEIHTACFAIAGPVITLADNTLADVTNLPWSINQQKLQIAFAIKHCRLINDFEAIGYALDALGDNDLVTLQTGTEIRAGIRAIIGAGTGLGQAIAISTTDETKVLGTEGGHVDFAPTSPLEIELLQFLQEKWPHVSYERILSGSGIVNLFEFLLQHRAENRSDYLSILESEDPAATIAEQAQDNVMSLATETMQLFTRIYGAQAGNLALACLPRGGLYIAGGIAAKNQYLIKSKHFLDAFCAKGRMETLLHNIPVKLITNTNLGLIGATQVALQMEKNS